MKKSQILVIVLVISFTFLLGVGQSTAQEAGPNAAQALGTLFTYQGQLKNSSGNPITSTCDFQFTLWDALSGVSQVGSVSTVTGISVVNGYFSLRVNTGGEFGANAFNGEARWLQIALKCSGDAAYTTLTPRQALTPTPYALALPGFYTQPKAISPNIIGGDWNNTVIDGVVGGTIGGGGQSEGCGTGGTDPCPNLITGNHGTISGGTNNLAATDASVGGGSTNTASYQYTTVGGGLSNNASGWSAIVGGGFDNNASSYASTVGGGDTNTASDYFATVGGGDTNTATGENATVSGGFYNDAGGLSATVPGGWDNTADGEYSFAAGICAQAMNDSTFVWADQGLTDECKPFSSTGNNQFLIRAAGGVGIGTNYPFAQLHIKGTDMDTVVFESNRGPNASNIQYGTNGDWYIRSAASAGKVILQDTGGIVGIGTNTPDPTRILHVAGGLRVDGAIRVDTLAGASGQALCYNIITREIATCSSSLRYKNNVEALSLGLETIAQLHPVTFVWKGTSEPDLGFVAEEVEHVTPLLTTRNAAGEIEGVKYDRISAVLVNAVQEQQTQIAALEAQLAALRSGTGHASSPLSTPWPWMALTVVILGGMVITRRQGARQ